MDKNRGAIMYAVCALSSLLLSCWSRNERDPNTISNSPSQDKFWFGVSIEATYFSPTRIAIRGTLQNSEGTIFSDSTKLFVNHKQMDYSVSIGNYYDKYPHYSIEIEKKEFLTDTLWFSVQLKDSSTHTIGYVYVGSLAPMISDANLRSKKEHDKKRPLLIDWGNNADSVNIYRNYYSLVDGVQSFSGGEYDLTAINRHLNKTQPIQLFTDYFHADSATVYGLHLSWIKNSKGKITNQYIHGTIDAIGKMEQDILLEKIDL
jgi:hypothetical protein